MTAAVVLAAGLGRRLAASTNLPKWLAPVGPTARPADRQLGALVDAGLRRVTVVVGDRTTEIEAAVEPWADRLDVRLLTNPHSATRNNWYSVLLALEHLDGGGDDVLVLNSDLFAGRRWLGDAIGGLLASGAPAALAIDPERGRSDEAMKVAIEAGRVTAIGKVGVDDPAGEYVGLAFWTAVAAAELADQLRSFESQPARVDHWYEHAIQEHLRAGARYAAVAVPSSAWVEIDDDADLDLARALPPDPT